MNKVDFKELNFPKGLNLDLLTTMMDEEKLKKFIVRYSRLPRLARRIVLPSSKTIKKVFFHYIFTLIEDNDLTWEEIKNEFVEEFGSLRALNISKTEARNLYLQRQKEIEREGNNGQ
jgi:hypothetical protein